MCWKPSLTSKNSAIGLIRYALKSIAGTRIRFLLTTLSVVIGVAFTVGVFVTTDGLRATFSDLSEDIFRGVDLSVRSQAEFGDREFSAPLVDPALEEVVRSVDGVAAAEGGIFEFNVIAIKPDGEALSSFGPPQMGVSWPTDDLLSQVSVWPDGISQPPQGPDEFAMDAGTARENGFEIGERYRVSTPTGTRTFTLVGHFRFGTGEEATVGAQIMAWDVETARQVLHDGGGFDSIDVRLEPGASVEGVTASLAAALPNNVEVVASQQLVEEQADEFNEVIGFFRNFLLGFAIVILVVSAFIIYNTFTILVGQRIRELGLLRALGASGRQVTAMVIGEAVVVGLVATGIGLGVGVLIAIGLQAIFSALGASLPDAPLIMKGATVFVAFVIGVGVTAISAIWPALRAKKVPPMAALAADVRLSVSDVRPAPVLGALLYGLGVALVVAGVAAQSPWIIVGAALVGFGAALFGRFSHSSNFRTGVGAGSRNTPASGGRRRRFFNSRHLGAAGHGGAAGVLGHEHGESDIRQSGSPGSGAVDPLAADRGAPRDAPHRVGSPLDFAAAGGGDSGLGICSMGVSWRLARQNAARTPRRTASTASALMIGLALVSMVTVLGQSFKQTLADVLDDSVSSDWLICVGNCGDPNCCIQPAGSPGYGRATRVGVGGDSQIPIRRGS